MNERYIDILTNLALQMLKKRTLSVEQKEIVDALKAGAKALLREEIRKEIGDNNGKEVL